MLTRITTSFPGEVILLTLFGIVISLAAYRIDQPMLVAAIGMAPGVGLFAWSPPVIICALFITFAHFRLAEA